MIYLEPNQIPAHILGNYRGKKLRAELVESVTIEAHEGNWNGGSRNVFYALDLATGRRASVTDTFSAPWDSNRHSQTIPLKSGFAVVKEIMFQGRDLGLTFYLLPSDAAPLLPPPSEELTETELRVLAVIRSYKSSYRPDAYRRAQISDAEAEAVKANLIRRGYLTKVGAITPQGRNAVGNRHA